MKSIIKFVLIFASLFLLVACDSQSVGSNVPPAPTSPLLQPYDGSSTHAQAGGGEGYPTLPAPTPLVLSVPTSDATANNNPALPTLVPDTVPANNSAPVIQPSPVPPTATPIPPQPTPIPQQPVPVQQPAPAQQLPTNPTTTQPGTGSVPQLTATRRVSFAPGTDSATLHLNLKRDAVVGLLLWGGPNKEMIVSATGKVQVYMLDPQGNALTPISNNGWLVYPMATVGDYTVVLAGHGPVTVTTIIPA